MVVEQERRREDTSCNYRICINNDATVYRRNGFFVGFFQVVLVLLEYIGRGAGTKEEERTMNVS